MTHQDAISIVTDLYYSEVRLLEREALGAVLYLALCDTNRTPELEILFNELHKENGL